MSRWWLVLLAAGCLVFAWCAVAMFCAEPVR